MKKKFWIMHLILFLRSMKLLLWDIVKVLIWRKLKHSLKWIRMKRRSIKPFGKRKNVKLNKKCEKKLKNYNANVWNRQNVVCQLDEISAAVLKVLVHHLAIICLAHRQYRHHQWECLTLNLRHQHRKLFFSNIYGNEINNVFCITEKQCQIVML